MEDEQRGASTATEIKPVAAPASAASEGYSTVVPTAKSPSKISPRSNCEWRWSRLLKKFLMTDKLLRLEVDLGTEQRQILAGIAESYAPESLVGRKVVIVANLAPRKCADLESNGMIVAASPEGGKAVLAGFLEDVPVGTRLK